LASGRYTSLHGIANQQYRSIANVRRKYFKRVICGRVVGNNNLFGPERLIDNALQALHKKACIVPIRDNYSD